jgi:hypothetical protein
MDSSYDEELRSTDDSQDEGFIPEPPKMTEEQRKQYLKRLYKLAGDHYTPAEKEEYLNKLYAERADASMIRAAAMQVYRARKAKEKEKSEKEHSPASVATPLDTKTAISMLKDRFVQLFSCADLKVVDDDGKSVKREEPVYFCGVDQKFFEDIENDIIEKHFSTPAQRTAPETSKGRSVGDNKRDTNFTKYGVASLDQYLSRQSAKDIDTTSGHKQRHFDKADTDLIGRRDKAVSREFSFNEEIGQRGTAPHTIYISNDTTDYFEEDGLVTNISTTNVHTEHGTKTVLIVPSTPKKKKTKPKSITNKSVTHDSELPFDEHKKVKTERITKLYDSVKNLPFDEASFTIAFNAEEFVDHMARESPISPDFFVGDDDDEIFASRGKGLAVEELELDVDYQYKR